MRDRRRRVDLEIERLQQLLRLDVEGAEAREQLLVAELDVLRRRHGRHQAGFLVDHADAGGERVARRLEINRLAVDAIGAGGEPDRAGDRLAERRLAGAVLADQRVHLAGVEVEIDAFDGVHAAVDLAAVADAEHRLARVSAGVTWRRAIPKTAILFIAAAPAWCSSTRPLPFDTMTRPCAVSIAAVMP